MFSSFIKKLSPAYLYNEAKYVFRHKNIRQAAVNSVAQILSAVIGLVSVSLLVRTLGADEYGKLNLVLTIVGTLSIFAGFGFIQAYSRVLLLNKDKEATSQIIGTGIVIFLVQTIALFFIVLLASPIILYIYKDSDLIQLLLWGNFISSFTLFSVFFYITTRNLNDMYALALKTIAQPICYLLFVYIIIYAHNPKIIYFLIANYIAILIPIVVYLIKKPPSFSHISVWWKKIRVQQKSFGIHIYITQIFERITFNLDSLMLGKVAYSTLTYYSLGMKLTQPISLVSTKFTDAYIRKFTSSPTIRPRLFVHNILWWIISTIILLVSAPYVIEKLWGSSFLHIYPFLFWMALSALCSNLYNVLFMFLYTKGIAKEQKKHFMIRAVINLAGNLLLIPSYGIVGAVAGTLLSNIYFLFGMWYEYRAFIKRQAATAHLS